MFNIFTIAFVAIVVALALAMFVTRRSPKPLSALVPPEEDFDLDKGDRAPLTLQHLFLLAEKLCEENNLKVKERMILSETEAAWLTESSNEFFVGNYVFGFLQVDDQHPYATMSNILEFKDFVKSMTSIKGYYFTTGYFTRDVHQPLEGPKVALYNRRKVLEEFKRLNLKWP